MLWLRREAQAARWEGEYSLNQSLTGLLAHLLDLFAAPPGAHGPRIAIVVLLLFELDLGAVAWYYDGAAGLPATQPGTAKLGRVYIVRVAEGGAGGCRAHVVCVGDATFGRWWEGSCGLSVHYNREGMLWVGEQRWMGPLEASSSSAVGSSGAGGRQGRT